MFKRKLPLNVYTASKKFMKVRADYYEYLADIIEGSEGSKKFQQIFEQDAVRFSGKSRGIVSAYWASIFSENGAILKLTWKGFFPSDEVALLDVAQSSGNGALITTLRDVAEGVRLKKEIESSVLATTLIAGIAIAVAFFMATLYPIFATNFLREAFPVVPEEYLRTITRRWFSYTEFLKASLPIILISIIAFAIYIYWSIDKLTGSFRDYLDKKSFLYKTIRDVRSVMFLTTLATITKPKGNSSMPLKKSLLMFLSSNQSKWLNWRIEQVITNIDISGGISSEVFNTNILSEDVFYYLRDMEQAKGFSEGFKQTSEYVKERMPLQISKKLNFYKYFVLGICGVIVFSVYTTQMSVIKSMTTSVKIYYSDKQN